MPGGSNLQIQYNNAGAFGGIPGSSWDGTNLTLPNVVLAGTTLVSSGGQGFPAANCHRVRLWNDAQTATLDLYGSGFLDFVGASFGFYQNGSPAFSYATTGITINSATGNLTIGANQVLGPRIVGYGTPTGNAQLVNFPGATATLAQTSAELAQLITDLKTHGLLGT